MSDMATPISRVMSGETPAPITGICDSLMVSWRNLLMDVPGNEVWALLVELQAGNVTSPRWIRDCHHYEVWYQGPRLLYSSGLAVVEDLLSSIDHHPLWYQMSGYSMHHLMTSESPRYVVASSRTLDQLREVMGEPGWTDLADPGVQGWALHGDHPGSWCLPGFTWSVETHSDRFGEYHQVVMIHS